MYIGVDCGTQSTKVVVVAPDDLQILAVAAAPHNLVSADNGRREQDPAEWVSAFEQALAKALSSAGISGHEVKAIGISGQQHGMVALDTQGNPVYPAKLWCDTESASENAALLKALGGPSGALQRLGLVVQTGYTASKVAWLREHQPEAYRKTATILLPHDYLNFYLTGNRVTEAGDASGTGYFDTRARRWREDVFGLVAPELDPEKALPELIDAQACAGRVRADVAARLGLGTDVVVSSGGGDNMMAAIGTGNIAPGMLTMSLGTSGTLFGVSSTPAISADGIAANFCSSHGNWLPLICTMNVTSATSQIQRLLGLDLAGFNQAAASAPAGAGGILMLPFFNGERVPPLPRANAGIIGVTGVNGTRENMARAVIEGVTFGLKYGYEVIAQSCGEHNPMPSSIRLVGGGAQSKVWRQVISDVLNIELACPASSEAAALGAALQAAWCEQGLHGQGTSLAALCSAAIRMDQTTHTQPDPDSVACYADVYEQYQRALELRYGQELQRVFGGQ